MANLYMINILAQDFHIWQHLGSNRSEVQLQHLTTIPSILVHTIYQHMLNNTPPIMPFDIDKESTECSDSIWTLFSHTGMYVTAIGSFILVGLGLFCCYFFWCQPARLACWPLQPGNTQCTIVDDDVEVALIYRCNGKDFQLRRHHKNHDLAVEHLPTWIESQCKQQLKSLVQGTSPCTRNIGKAIQNPGDTEMYVTSAVRLRLTPHTTTTKLRIDRWKHSNTWPRTLPFDVQ